MADPRVGGGVVSFTLDGKPQQLVPSLEACIEISNIAGGINGAIQRVTQLNFETICYIIGAGLEVNGRKLNPGQRDKMLPEAVYKTGLIALMQPCITFCHVVANGGELPSDDDDEDVKKEGDDAPLG